MVRRSRFRTGHAALAFLFLMPVAGKLWAQKNGSAGSSAAAAAELHQAVIRAGHGDLAGALVLADAMVLQHPGYAPGVKFKGAMLEESGHPQEAEVCYEQALKLMPADEELLYKVGVFRLLAGDKDGAITIFNRRLKLAPKDAETLFYLAQAYHLRGDNELALKAIARSVQVEPGSGPMLQKYGELLCTSGDNTAALTWLQKAQQVDPSLDRIDFDLAVASYRNQDLENAVQYATKAAQLRPNDVTALALLAETEVKLARWRDAEPVFERVLALKSDDPASLLGLGHCELALKQYQLAIDTLQTLVRQDATTILGHFYLSRAYAGLGQTVEAQHEAELHGKLVEQASSVVPQEERKIEEAALVQARKMLSEGHETEALQLFRERAKGPTATVGAPYLLVGVVYLYMGQSEDAERSLNKALAIEPKVREVHTYLGLLALQRQDLDDAEAQFRLELALNPNSQLAVAELGEVRYRQQRWADAVDQLTRSRTVSPALLYMLADSYFHLAQVKEANLTAELAAGYAKSDRASIERLVALLNQNQQTDLATRIASR